jgi:Flp pilus assembly protein TadB
MKFFKKLSAAIVLVLPLAFLSLPSIAQPGPGNPQNGDPDVVPITGIEYLLVSGGLLGGYKLLKRKVSKE